MMTDGPMGAPQPQEPEQSAGGFVIEIAVSPDRTITVGKQGAAEDGAEAQARPVSSIKEALAMALSIYKSNGQINSQGQDEQVGFDSTMVPERGDGRGTPF